MRARPQLLRSAPLTKKTLWKPRTIDCSILFVPIEVIWPSNFPFWCLHLFWWKLVDFYFWALTWIAKIIISLNLYRFLVSLVVPLIAWLCSMFFFEASFLVQFAAFDFMNLVSRKLLKSSKKKTQRRREANEEEEEKLWKKQSHRRDWLEGKDNKRYNKET